MEYIYVFGTLLLSILGLANMIMSNANTLSDIADEALKTFAAVPVMIFNMFLFKFGNGIIPSYLIAVLLVCENLYLAKFYFIPDIKRLKVSNIKFVKE